MQPPLSLFNELAEWKSFSPGLSRVKRVLRKMGTPYFAFPHMVVGGTNGKGTVSTTVARAISGRVGLLLSPHVQDIRERITINGEWVCDDKWQHAHARITERVPGVDLSYFEWLLVLAVQIFYDEDVDYAVFEIGLGGRLDSVNTLNPDICVITNVSLDHMELLGDNQTAIALEKIEIARPNKVMVLPNDVYAIPQVQQRLQEIGCRTVVFEGVEGFHGNLAVVEKVFEELGLKGPVELAQLVCRKENLEGQIFLDGAHNEAAWHDLVAWIRRQVSGKLPVLCSLSIGRDPQQFMQILDPVAELFHVWQAGYEKELPIADWPDSVSPINEKDLKRLLKGPLLVSGSLYLAGLFKEWYAANKGQNRPV